MEASDIPLIKEIGDMFSGKRLLPSSLLLVALQLAGYGCAQALYYRNSGELESRARTLKTIAMLPSEVKISELSAGGISELRDEWSAAGKQNTERAILGILNENRARAVLLQPEAQMKREIEDIMPLFKAVMSSIYTHAYVGQGNPNVFPGKLEKFDYSIGSLERIVGKHRIDGILIVFGEDEISSTGRKALRIVQAINPFGEAQRSGVTVVAAALVDKSGDILWFNSYAESGGYDLRNYESARDFVRIVLRTFPGGRQ
jgi:hypothetical protein